MAENGKTILLIEDEEVIRELYAEVLRDAGYKVIEARDGDAGLKRALGDEWDIMLLDIHYLFDKVECDHLIVHHLQLEMK